MKSEQILQQNDKILSEIGVHRVKISSTPVLSYFTNKNIALRQNLNTKIANLMPLLQSFCATVLYGFFVIFKF